ncbi:multidrug resistance-associated protein 1-like isoform X2 [Xenia sp. Carnegie-2017]|uniref:multidrug resistance-associated protein 1-like isoform X2 n=1 Tax=Xenia sp. Carnegie-2017 TaxID=2897299 RepID=UPI001F04BD44|nr:multidrug resistance-associated protein 1-like isoform X2 [Xenia sp. Carnegie-2017]
MHVVALYDYFPGQSDITDVWYAQAPHINTHLNFAKGDLFEVIGDVDWWLYVKTNDGESGYIPSLFTAPVNDDCLNKDDLSYEVLSCYGDVPSRAIDVSADLTFFPDVQLHDINEFHHMDMAKCPEESANIFSRITFWWMTGLVRLGYSKPLVTKDLWYLQSSLMSKNIEGKFIEIWEHEKERVSRKFEKLNSEKTKYVNEQSKYDSDDHENLHDEVKYSCDESKEKHPSLMKTLLKMFFPFLIPAILFKFCYDSLVFVQPQLLGMIVEFVDDENDRPLYEGLIYAASMFVVATFQTLVLQQYFKIVLVTGLRLRTSVLGIVYRKALVLSNYSRNQSTIGEMVNLMSVDAQRLMDILTYLNLIWSSPYQIILAIYFLYRAMGISVLAGVAVMLVIFPLNFFIGRWLRNFQVKQMNIKDSRIKLMNEILNGIKVLKLFAWETSFLEKTSRIRKNELRILRFFSYLNAILSFFMSSSPVLVSLATFATYVSLGNTLTASKAFVALALFETLRFPLSMLARLLTNLIQALVSIKRLQRFLNMEELDPNHIERSDISKGSKETAAIKITSGTFSWENEKQPILNEINLKVNHGGLVAIVGHVGCGKSSLLSAILGDIKKLAGHVYLQGSVAYVSQQAWIQNATLRENILFGKRKNNERYRLVIDKCALKPDLQILPGGDMTEIGEKGINLSGGQKQRVSLARAVYSDADIYLLDDPLSAVDAHVGKHIFDFVIGPNGMLKNKVRFLPQVDQIIVLRNGVITEIGSYTELQANQGDFAEFLKIYATEHNEDREHVGNRSRSKSQISTTSFMNNLNVDDGKSNVSSSNGNTNKLTTKTDDENAREDHKMIKEEKAETGRVKYSVFIYYFASCGIHFICLLIFFLLCSEASLAVSRVWLAHWSSSNVTESSQQNYYIGVYAALGISRGIFILLVTMTLAKSCVKGSRFLHHNLLVNVLRLPLSFFESTPLGRIVNRFSKDIDVIDAQIPLNLWWFFETSTSVLGVIFLICYSTPLFMTVLLPLVVLYVFIQRFYVTTSRQLQRLESISRSPVYSHFFETLNGVSTIRAFNAQQRFIMLNNKNVDENSMVKYPVIIINRWLAVRLELIGNCVIFFAALFGVLARESIESGLVGLSITVSLKITGSLNWLVRQTSELETHIVSVERVKEYTEAEQEAAWTNLYQAPANWPDKGEIEFKQLGIRYRSNLPLALKKINGKIGCNEKIGIVGRTGSGKSTLTMALFRTLEASEGNITIDGINIAHLGLHLLRSKITIIPQDPILFSTSLRYNLDPFERHTDEEVWSALEMAHLKSFVSQLPNSVNFMISEGGENLSVGQRQLVCLARALLRRTKILVLDEATAAVDLETDELIQQTIRKEFADCTVLTIAHRLNTIMDYTRIMVLSEGEVKEFDSPSNLLEQKGMFYEMAKHSNLVV